MYEFKLRMSCGAWATVLIAMAVVIALFACFCGNAGQGIVLSCFSGLVTVMAVIVSRRTPGCYRRTYYSAISIFAVLGSTMAIAVSATAMMAGIPVAIRLTIILVVTTSATGGYYLLQRHQSNQLYSA